MGRDAADERAVEAPADAATHNTHSTRASSAAKFIFSAVALASYGRLFFGFDFADESFYTALPYSFHLGHRPLLDELAWDPLGGLLLLPWVELYVLVTSSSDGLVLYLRHVYFAGSLACAWLAARYFSQLVGPALGVLIGAVVVACVPIAMASLGPNTLASLSLLASLLLMLGAAASRRPLVHLAVGSLFAALCTFVDPVLACATVPALMIGGLLTLRRRTDLSRARIVLCLAAPSTLVASISLALWMANGGPGVLVPLPDRPVDESFAAAPSILAMLGLGALPLLVWRRGVFAGRRSELVAIAALSAVAGFCRLGSSANDLQPAALALLPAALVGLALVCGPSAPDGRRDTARPRRILHCAIFLALISGLQVASSWLHVYRNHPIPELSTPVIDGPWAGIRTSPVRNHFIATLRSDLADLREDARTILFFDSFPAGYLLSDLAPSTAALWMFPAAPPEPGAHSARQAYADHFETEASLPDLVVRMQVLAYKDRLPEDATDPVRSIFGPPAYATVLKRPSYTILRRSTASRENAGPNAVANTAAGGSGERLAPKPSNLILISIDTLRADHVGAYGYPRPTTPVIDQLAAESVRFETCIAHSPTTLASHASILTSLLPLHHGASIARKTSLADGVTTLAQVLQTHGYRTAAFNGGIQLDAVYGLDRGFDDYESTKPWDSEAEVLSGRENRMQAAVDRALAWLGDSDRPFFLFLHSYEIHHPYTPDDRHLEVFDADYQGSLGNEISVEFLKDVKRRGATLTASDLQHVINAYDAELRSVDESLGILFARLRKRGLYDDSMIIVTSDHGEEFGDHGVVGWHAHTLFDELLKVPLIVKYPGSRHRGVVVASQVRGIDVAPTTLAGLGIEIPAEFTGSDLTAAIEGSPQPMLPALSTFDRIEKHPSWAVRTPEWKVLSHSGLQLFDLRQDPSESTNLAERDLARVIVFRTLARSFMNDRPKAEGNPVRPRNETLEQLRELGYIE